jgi:subtilisin family serine protease
VKDALAKGSASILSETSDRCLVLVGPSCDPIEFAGVIALLPEVASAEADLVHIGGSYGTYSPSLCEDADPEAAAGAYRLARVKEAWDILEGRELHDVLVAILDDGVDAAHPDLASIQLPHFDSFAGELASFPLSHDHHGTCCAGLVVAQPITDGMKGVGCGARLLPIRVNHRVTASSDIITSSWRLILGIDEAVAQGADVLSLSWSAEVCDTIQASIEAAATAGRNRRGCVIVAAAGNDGGSVRFPASLDCVIAVAGCDENGLLIRRGQVTSNYGPEVDVTAPALPMFTTIPGNGYTGCFGGTSAATALVAGAAALVLQVNPELTAKEVRDLLVATSTTQQDVVNGRVALLKVLNVEAAVNAIIVREPRQ